MSAQRQATKERRFLEFLKEQRKLINREVDEQELKVMRLEAKQKQEADNANT